MHHQCRATELPGRNNPCYALGALCASARSSVMTCMECFRLAICQSFTQASLELIKLPSSHLIHCTERVYLQALSSRICKCRALGLALTQLARRKSLHFEVRGVGFGVLQGVHIQLPKARDTPLLRLSIPSACEEWNSHFW